MQTPGPTAAIARRDQTVAPFQSGHEKDAHRGHAQHHGSAKIGHHHRKITSPTASAAGTRVYRGLLMARAPPRHEERQKDHQCRLGQFGRLQTARCR